MIPTRSTAWRGWACWAAVFAICAATANADDKPDGSPPIWEDPDSLQPVPIPWLSTGPANDVTAVGEDDSVCGPPGTEATANVGQTFIPRTDRIWRMDFATLNAYNGNIDPRPGIVRIFKWQPKGYLATVATRPLFAQHVDLTEYNTSRLSLYPDLRFSPEERDDSYFVEFSIPGKESKPARAWRHPYFLDAIRSATDPYPDGFLVGRCIVPDGARSDGPPGQRWDLWFRFYGAEPRTPAARPLNPSDPDGDWMPPLAPSKGDLREQYWRRVNDYMMWSRPSVLAPNSTGAHAHLLFETMLYLACKNDERCPRWLDPEDLLDGIRRIFQRGVEERAACRNPRYPECYSDFIQLYSPGLAYLLLREAGALDKFSPELRAGIRDLFFKRALELSFPLRINGTNNWALNGMATCLMFHVLFPEQTPREWIDYYRTIWKSFWEVRDTETDSDGYNQISFIYILVFARFAPSAPDASSWYADIWSDPHFRKEVDRFREMVTPIGLFPNYGDGTGVSLTVPALIWLFEEAATHFKDPSYREAAGRLLEFNARRARSRPLSAGGFWDSFDSGPTFQGLAMAYLAAGSAKAPEQPSAPGSVYTLRRRAARRGDPPPPAPAYTFSMSSDAVSDVPASLIATAPGAQSAYYVPDKLILRSGEGPDGLAFVFNLLNGYNHGHPEIGA